MWMPVLLYHRVTNELSVSARGLCVTPRTFESHMRFLHERGFTVVPLHDVVDAIEGKRGLAPRSLAITFDDGYRDIYYNAFPILQRYGFTATIFLVSSLIGGSNEWDQRLLGSRPVSLLSAAEIGELARGGIGFGSHSGTHPRLTSLGDEDLWREVALSKSDLEDRLGLPITMFAYPHLATDHRVASAVRAAGYIAAAGGDAPEEPTRYNVNRILVSGGDRFVTYLKLLGLHRQLRTNPLLRRLKDRIEGKKQHKTLACVRVTNGSCVKTS